MDSLKSPAPIKDKGLVSFAAVAFIFTGFTRQIFRNIPPLVRSLFQLTDLFPAMALNPSTILPTPIAPTVQNLIVKKCLNTTNRSPPTLEWTISILKSSVLSVMFPPRQCLKVKPMWSSSLWNRWPFKLNIGGHPQNPTPEIERLANSGLFV